MMKNREKINASPFSPMQMIQKIFFYLRHNIFVYMFWDVPWKLPSPFSKKKKLMYLLQLNLAVAGLLTAELWYPNSISPPAFSQLSQTKGKLEEVILETVKGHMASIVKIRDEFGKEWVFPKGSRHLPIKRYEAIELEERCIGKEIVIRWRNKAKLFLLNGGVEVWSMETCNPQITVDHHEMVESKKNDVKRNKFIVVFGLSVFIFCFFGFFSNFRKAKELLIEKKLSNQ